MKARGASNINPCPECQGQWFTVVDMRKTCWVVVCCNCNTEYIKPLNVAKDAKQMRFDFGGEEHGGHG